jgi:hypothetical protein
MRLLHMVGKNFKEFIMAIDNDEKVFQGTTNGR